MTDQQLVVAVETTALVPQNAMVQAVATTLRINPERLIVRIQKALPAVVEQQLYLQVGGDFRLQPESMAKLLREYLGDQELVAADLTSRSLGGNLVSNRFNDVAGFLQQVFGVISKDLDIPVSMRHAARLVIAYGEHAEEVLDDLIANAEYIRERFKLKTRKTERIVGFGIGFLVDKVLPKMAREGRPHPRTLTEYFEREGLSESLRLMIADERDNND